jgi:ATP-dependent Clp protease ATP-binding subunit ClpA
MHNGKKVDFRNVILIMTTNAGHRTMIPRRTPFRLRPRQEGEGEQDGGDQRCSPPEFRNRLDPEIRSSRSSAS